MNEVYLNTFVFLFFAVDNREKTDSLLVKNNKYRIRQREIPWSLYNISIDHEIKICIAR